MVEATEFEDFFNEMFAGKDPLFEEDSQHLIRELNERVKEQDDIFLDLQEMHKRMAKNFSTYTEKFNKKNKKADKNIEDAEKQVKGGKIIKKDLKIDIKKFIDFPRDFIIPNWFDGFLAEELGKFRDTLVKYADKQFKARFNPEIIKSRKYLDDESKNKIKHIDKEYIEGENFLEPDFLVELLELQRIVIELEYYDQLIPHYLLDISKRVTDYCKRLLVNFSEFTHSCKFLIDKIDEYSASDDKTYMSLYMNLHQLEPESVRTARYSHELRNRDLITLREGNVPQDKIVSFLVEYFRERNQMIPLKGLKGIMVSPFAFFNSLVAGGDSRQFGFSYEAVKNLTDKYKGRGLSIFEKFDKLLYVVGVGQRDWIIVMVRNRPEKEIIVFDHHQKHSGGLHPKLFETFKKYIFEELKDKSERPQDECRLETDGYVCRVGNCPQILHMQDSPICMLKNLKILADGNELTAGTYTNYEDLKQFRYNIFCCLLRIGLNQDGALDYEILL